MTMNSHRVIVEAATALAGSLPTSTVEAVAAAILTSSTSGLKAEIAKRVAHHHHRDRALAFVDCWWTEAIDVDAGVVAVALQTAALSEQRHRDSQTVELVWTGPESGDMPFRRTEQAILQLLDSARERITLVSFAVYRIPNIAHSLVKAARRGVKLTVIVETPDKLGGENEYSTLRALGSEVEVCSSVYFWPKENRKLSETNKPGLLHVKCAVADGEWLFLSSANLTQQAFTINMELGMLVRGGTMPSRVEKQFERLIQSQQLQLVTE
jgi:phosphatidylserine/phosphatidylglycerophosphate/cardiolipin synthase-like enzyme